MMIMTLLSYSSRLQKFLFSISIFVKIKFGFIADHQIRLDQA